MRSREPTERKSGQDQHSPMVELGRPTRPKTKDTTMTEPSWTHKAVIKMIEAREGSVNIHDTCLGVWEEHVGPDFQKKVFGSLIRFMRSRGWKVGEDPEIKKHYRCLNKTHRAASKKELRAKLSVSGRCIELKVWSENWPSENRNGHQHNFDIRQKMPYLTGIRCDLELKKIQCWLAERHSYQTEDDFNERRGRRTPMERIADGYDKSWHIPVRPGYPRIDHYGCTSANGETLKQGQTVWVRGYDGRMQRGKAYVNINNMWWVVTGGELHNVASFDIHTVQPADLRRKIKPRQRRARLERLINEAVDQEDFARAELLKRVLFNDQPLYRVWSNKHGGSENGGSFWGPCNAGYFSKRWAGRYTHQEVLALVSAHPGELRAVPIGNAPQIEARAAA